MARKKKNTTRQERIDSIVKLDLGLKVKEIEKLAKADVFQKRFKYLKQKSLMKKNIEYQVSNGIDEKTAKKNARKSQKTLTNTVETQVLKTEIFDVTERTDIGSIQDEFWNVMIGLTTKPRSFFYDALNNISKTKGNNNVGIIVGRAYVGNHHKKNTESFISDRYNITKNLTNSLRNLYVSGLMVYEPPERILLINQWVMGFLFLETNDKTKHDLLCDEIKTNLKRFVF